jgi:hypothetical protein
MSNPFDEMRAAVAAAKAQLQAADESASDMALLLKGRLRHVGAGWRGVESLKALKKELHDFNMATGKWKS